MSGKKNDDRFALYMIIWTLLVLLLISWLKPGHHQSCLDDDSCPPGYEDYLRHEHDGE